MIGFRIGEKKKSIKNYMEFGPSQMADQVASNWTGRDFRESRV
jgi:hypothetical protein